MTTVIIPQESPPVRSAVAGEIRIDPAGPADIPAALALLASCSTRTLFRRFHGHSDGMGYTRASLQDPRQVNFMARLGREGLGLATLAPDQDRGVYHLAALVVDAWQRQGVGTGLMTRVITEARARGIGSVHADIGHEDGFIVRALRRIGPIAVTAATGTFGIDLQVTSPLRTDATPRVDHHVRVAI